MTLFPVVLCIDGAYQLASVNGWLCHDFNGGAQGHYFPHCASFRCPPENTRTGRSVSYVYMANILGATLGPFVTGMIMLSAMNTQDCFAVCAELTFVVSLFCFRDDFEFDTMAIGALVAVLILSFIVVQESKQMMAQVALPVGNIHRIIENRYGIVTIYDGGNRGDKVFGGNVYDGRTNLDPIINSNHINRVLIMAALIDHPQNVLIIGLSIGTWLKLITSFPDIKNIDVVEINPGYLDAITDYPQQQCALVDPRVHVYIDDGRRWLRNHPEKNMILSFRIPHLTGALTPLIYCRANFY